MIQPWIQSLFAESGLHLWPLSALGIFLLFFAAMLAWVFRRGSDDLYRRQARLPLEGGPAAQLSDNGIADNGMAGNDMAGNDMAGNDMAGNDMGGEVRHGDGT